MPPIRLSPFHDAAGAEQSPRRAGSSQRRPTRRRSPTPEPLSREIPYESDSEDGYVFSRVRARPDRRGRERSEDINVDFCDDSDSDESFVDIGTSRPTAQVRSDALHAVATLPLTRRQHLRAVVTTVLNNLELPFLVEYATAVFDHYHNRHGLPFPSSVPFTLRLDAVRAWLSSQDEEEVYPEGEEPSEWFEELARRRSESWLGTVDRVVYNAHLAAGAASGYARRGASVAGQVASLGADITMIVGRRAVTVAGEAAATGGQAALDAASQAATAATGAASNVAQEGIRRWRGDSL
ncbi:hypothetical protein BT63DRAFT_452031 [Microthyrium microscopicum]|uniref:Uncharacterized protein n=1 Tax=Microthyrium microscopicum TaxID=703497 RepID=A0A6A6UR86_9PEZI|nr:hypothetical protein BT63DRAFT_452031 [Microthyrium microscopicum]